MSELAVQTFLDRMLRDASLRSEAAAALSAVATRHGLVCAPAECEHLLALPVPVPDGELSDDALSAVAGGAGAAPVGVSLSVSASMIGCGINTKTLGQ